MRSPLVALAAGTAAIALGLAAVAAGPAGGQDGDADRRPTETVAHEPATTAAPPTSAVPAPSTTTTTAPPPAPAWSPADQAPGWEQRLGAAALATIAFDPAAVGYEVHFLPGQPGRLGTTYPRRRLIEVWVRPGMTVPEVAAVTAHELGHAVDVEWNTAERRLRYRTVRGLPGGDWFTCNGCTDFATPAGDFAEVFAWWALGGTTPFRSELAPPPSAADLAQLAPLFAP